MNIQNSNPARENPGGGMPRLAQETASLFVVIKVTEACNMGCKYCSAEKDITKVPVLKPEVAARIIDALHDLGLGFYSVCFHGGEPLLGFPAVSETVCYAKDRYPDTEFRFSMQSNLVRMTPEIAQWCAEHGVSVGFSIDGVPEDNDLMRIFHNGRGTTEATVRGLKILQAHQPHVGCVAVIGGHNWNQMHRFIPYLNEIGVTRLALNRMAPVGRALKIGRAAYVTDEEYVQCLTDCYLAMVASAFEFQVKPITDWARKIVSPGSCSHGCYQCGAGWSHISVDSTGNVYACDRFSFDPDWVSGNLLDTPLLDIMNEQKMHNCRTRIQRISTCSKCAVVDVCGGSCAVTSYYAKGTIDTPGHECGNMRQFIPWLRQRLDDHLDERAAFEAMALGYDPRAVMKSLHLQPCS